MEIIMGMDTANHHIVKGIGDERSNMQNNNYTGKKNICGQNSLDKEFESENQIINNIVKRKVCTEWTQDLHVKFMDAVVQLGEGRCFPKEILELMNVPGLTRTQVASHLQKCRNNNWRAPEERKSQQNNSPADSINIDVLSRKKPRRFGSMPPSKNTPLIKERRETGQSSNIYSTNENPNDGGRRHENINIEPIVDSHELFHENFVYGQNNASTTSNSSSNPRYPLDDFFSFPDRDCLTQNFSGKQQGAEMIMNQRHCQKTLHFDQVYHEEVMLNFLKGFAGPLASARDNLVDDSGKPFFVLNSDVISEYPLQGMIKFQKSREGDASILLTKVRSCWMLFLRGTILEAYVG
ncbi:two-component response regulator ARR14-like [Olea europaea subsp. europaea]|uniref:Two-component response regulator ARR14-like n=1 Tax=Olea europaea subsp. europaea TaxID=158383 RepID=A0A8S0Q6N1_OLEEU|nr:two-component response regulator ARR14-like [Olea europaea subsp. europaea]